MKFRLFKRTKQPTETVDIGIGFSDICNRHESKLTELCINWEQLIKKWDLLFESLDERVRSETNETLRKTLSERGKDFGQVIISFTSVTKSMKKELIKLSNTLTKEQNKLLKAKAKTWLEDVLGASELSRGRRFLFKMHIRRSERYRRKLNKLLKEKEKALKAASQQKRLEQIEQERAEQERIRVRETQLRWAEEIRLTCKTCRHTPAQREEQVQQLVSINLTLLGDMASEKRTRKREEELANALKWKRRFGESALVEMNSRQRERTKLFEPERCPECQFPFFGRYG